MSSDADKLVKNYSAAAESIEATRLNIEKSTETTQLEKEEAIANVYEMAGKIKATNFQKSQSTLFNLMLLKQVKESKDYRTKMGMTWEKFCEYVGVDRRRVDEELMDLRPFKGEFLADFATFSGATINKIKYIGESISGGFAEITDKGITIAGQTIPFKEENLDEIQTILKTREEEQQKKIEDLEAANRAEKKVAAAKEKVINTLERDLKRLEKTVEKTDLTEEEQDAINLLAQVQKDFLQGLSDIKKKIKPHDAPVIALRQLYFLWIFIAKVAMEERLALNQTYRDAEEVPWEIMEQEIPDADVLIDNLPLSAGKGMGKKVKAKIAERTAAAAAKKADPAGKTEESV
jgi:uncharacterized membrane protein